MGKTYKNQQLELFPEQPKEVKAILGDLQDIEKNLEFIKRAFEISQSSLWANRRAAKQHLQEVCIHPEIKIEHEHEYHNNIWWEVHTCTTCEKEIKRI